MDDPNAMAGMDAGMDPNGAAPMDDPNAMPEGGEDLMAGGGDMAAGDENADDDSTMSIINQLSPTDREAVRAYAESMLARDETNGEEEMPEAEPAGQEPGVMMEISKGRLAKIQNRLSEMFGDNMLGRKNGETDREQKKVKKGKNSSPFDKPF